MEKKFRIRRVPLEMLMKVMSQLWDEGVEYVDMEATITPSRDRVEFLVQDDYFIPPNDACFSEYEYEQLIYLGP